MSNLFLLLLGFGSAFLLVMIITPHIIVYAKNNQITAKGRFAGEKKTTPIPLLGGIAVYGAVAITVIVLTWQGQFLVDILPKHITGLLLGGVWIILGGFLDDKYSLKPKYQIIWPMLAVITVIVSGIGITHVTNPISPEKLIYLDNIKFTAFTVKGMPYHITLIADAFTFLWLWLIMYSTKLQDGLDGLVSGISFIGSFFIFILSWFVFEQYDLGVISIILAGALLGFLYFNKFPAKIFLGEGGSVLLGFMLGTIAIMSDAKVIITLIILALPIIDVLWTVVRRLRKGIKPWQGDQDHLHHQLVKAGLTHQQSVWTLYILTVIFGILVLLWQSSFAFYFEGLILIIFSLILGIFWLAHQKNTNPN